MPSRLLYEGGSRNVKPGNSIPRFTDPGRGKIGWVVGPDKKPVDPSSSEIPQWNAGYPSFDEMMVDSFLIALNHAATMLKDPNCNCSSVTMYIYCQDPSEEKRGFKFLDQLNTREWCNTKVVISLK